MVELEPTNEQANDQKVDNPCRSWTLETPEESPEKVAVQWWTTSSWYHTALGSNPAADLSYHCSIDPVGSDPSCYRQSTLEEYVKPSVPEIFLAPATAVVSGGSEIKKMWGRASAVEWEIIRKFYLKKQIFRVWKTLLK
ncbi:hypothetical protein EVAR_18251_1 [Eumeta japonica]|uniref:Uncharacterized protein n=1 Tax=Eumeta variegata TaxID=151549 RepID=A0A4C1UL57_EUMVA|nr:hypothetical protein EVAR_18251_1 [Eumeta japonica]